MSQQSLSSGSEEQYVVESILNKRIQKGKTYYLVKWQGFPESEATWEPIQNLKNVMDLVQEFEELQSKKVKVIQTNQLSESDHKNIEKENERFSSPDPKKKQQQTKSHLETQQSKLQEKKEQFTIPKEKIKERKIISTYQQGSYDDNDSAQEILCLRKDNERKCLEFQVAWKKRKNQKIPLPSWIPDHELKVHNPRVLCDFLLKKIKWNKQDNE